MATVTVKSISEEQGYIVVVADVGGEIDHPIYMHRDAIPNRIDLYELATHAEALDAIMREHELRISGAAAKSETLLDVLGGVDDRVSVDWLAEAVKQRDKLFPAVV